MQIVLTPDEVKDRLANHIGGEFGIPVDTVVIHQHGGATLTFEESGQPELEWPEATP
jgi:hypothetical protein